MENKTNQNNQNLNELSKKIMQNTTDWVMKYKIYCITLFKHNCIDDYLSHHFDDTKCNFSRNIYGYA